MMVVVVVAGRALVPRMLLLFLLVPLVPLVPVLLVPVLLVLGIDRTILGEEVV